VVDDPSGFVSSVISSRSAALACKAATAFSMSATGKRAITVTLMTVTSFEWPNHPRRGSPAKLRHFCCARSGCEFGIAVTPGTEFDAAWQALIDAGVRPRTTTT
jgi:hypothetical protein